MRTLIFLAAVGLITGAGSPPTRAAAQTAAPTVNGAPASPELIAAIRTAVNAEPSGLIWYDPVSGLIGEWGEPAAAQIVAGLVAPPVPADASAGLSRVFVNGRELPLSAISMLEHTYTMIVEGQYTMGPDLIMYKYPGAPGINYAAARAAYRQDAQAERQWCAMARERAQAAPPGTSVYIPEIGGGAYSVQVTMDANGCMMTNVQGQIFSRCCGD